MKKDSPRVAVIGGGAAGFFAAITAAECMPSAQISIYEAGSRCLRKVKVSGGGRCNVTHSCFDPAVLANFYPRGSRELRAAFYRWQPEDMISWFAGHGIELKTENDGRMFPVSDDSQTIIDCFSAAVEAGGAQLVRGAGIQGISVQADGRFALDFGKGGCIEADKVCLACGSLKGSPLSEILSALGHTVEPLVPSLFAFNVIDQRIHDLSGLSVQKASLHVVGDKRSVSGPLLITHRGFSGPAVLRLSAWEARSLHEKNYRFRISINWLGDLSETQLREQISWLRQSHGKATIRNRTIGELPRRLWESLVEASGISPEIRWAQIRKTQEDTLITELIDGQYDVRGKTTNKEEFVTCGGVRLKEVDFRTMQSRLVPGLFFAGECLDIDGITGGFNFQAAWTTGRIAGSAMAES